MKKRIIIKTVFITLAVVLILCAAFMLRIFKYGTVFVDGKWLPGVHVSSYTNSGGEYVALPVAATLQHLGYDIVQQDDNTIQVNKDDKSFIMDLAALTFKEEGKDFDFFLQPPGGTYYYCQRQGNDVIVDESIFYVIVRRTSEEFYMTTIPKWKFVYFEPIVFDSAVPAV